MQSFLSYIPFLHNGVFIALIAHGLIGISLVWDKVLLKKPETTNLISYVFWLGAISIFGLALIPFGFRWPHLWVIGLAFGTGILHLVAVYFYYAALKAGEASQTLAVMGGFSPVATAIVGVFLLKEQMGFYALIGFALLTAGGFLMFFAEQVPFRNMMFHVVVASVAFGFVNVFEKLVYDNTNFVSGYVFFTLGTFVAAVSLLIRPTWRTTIFHESENAEPSSRFWYFVNRFIAGVGSFLVFYAISLTNPALVDAITAVRYVIIFLGAYFLTKLRPAWLSENFTGKVLASKSVATALVIVGLVILGWTGKGAAGTSTAVLRNSHHVTATASVPQNDFVLSTPLRRFVADAWPLASLTSPGL